MTVTARGNTGMVRPFRWRLMGVGGALLIGLAAAAAAAGPAAAGERAGAAGASSLPVAIDTRLGGDESRTRFIIDVSHTISLTAFTLADPYRVVIDLPQVSFQFPAKTGESGRGLVKAFRYGLVMPGGSRIVIDLVTIDRESFMRSLALENQARRAAEPRKSDREPAKAGDQRPLVMLDPGHGGIDDCTTAPSGETEKSIVLDFTLGLRDKLEKSGKYRVAMTRSDDRFIPLAERVRMARQQKAALFISIHADALAKNEGDARGAAIYTLSETASDAEAGKLADAENRADLIAGVDLSGEPDDVADILIDLAQRETKHFSAHFAKTLHAELKTSAKFHKHPLKSAGFRVLTAPDVPSVLVELGYVTSPQDLKLMTSESWRARATDSIVQAIHTFFSKRLTGQGPVSAN